MEPLPQELDGYWQWLMEAVAFDSSRLLEPEMLLRLLLQLSLMVASAFFSSSETALFSLSRIELRELHRTRHPQAKTLYALLDQPRRLIISILCGNELINIAAAANMTVILVVLYGEEQALWMNLLVMVPMLLLFGEVTPKTIAVSSPVMVSTRIIASPLNLWVRFVAPFRWLVRLLADRLTTFVVGEEKSAENILHVDEFRTLVDEVVKNGGLTSTERILIDNLLAAGTTEIVEIMTPRTRMPFVDAALCVPEMVTRVRQLRQARVPVCRQSRDTIIGFIHAEELMHLVLEDADLSALAVDAILHPPLMVPPTKKVDEMFGFFLDHQAEAALVLDEFGGIDGFITLHDVINFTFGNAAAEEKLERLYREDDTDIFDVAGEMKLTDFNKITNFGISDRRMTTIAGVVLRHLGRLPAEGDEVVLEGVHLQVKRMDGYQIAWLRAAKIKQKDDTQTEDDDESGRQQGADNS